MAADRSDYAPHQWHDNLILGLSLDLGDIEAGDWRSTLALDIDHIVSWSCALDGVGAFHVAPATLQFFHATDLRIAVDCGDSGGQTSIHEWSIDCITRRPIENQKICFDRPYYAWRIELNWPRGGLIGFAASDFALTLRAEPLALAQPKLPAAYRRHGAGAQ